MSSIEIKDPKYISFLLCLGIHSPKFQSLLKPLYLNHLSNHQFITKIFCSFSWTYSLPFFSVLSTDTIFVTTNEVNRTVSSYTKGSYSLRLLYIWYIIQILPQMKFLSYIESPVLFKEKHLYSNTLPTKYQIKFKKKKKEIS